MKKDIKENYERLKKEYLEADRVHHEEKECLLKVINTLGIVVAGNDGFSREFDAIKKMINNNSALPLDLIEKEISQLRTRIFEIETKKGTDSGNQEQLDDLKNRLLGACRIVKRIMVTLLDDFYPATPELKAKADAINIKCTEKTSQREFEEATGVFLRFINDLKRKISDDFRYINNTFLMLLEQVRALEKTLTKEFGGDFRLKEIEQFEMKVNSEVGSIVNSFNIYATVNEIKSAVIEKLTNIKRIVSIRKKEEMKRSKKAQEKIVTLKNRIFEAEKDAIEMSKKAERFEIAATRDGLSGLYNRKAFDIRVDEAMKKFDSGGDPFSVVLFDVDNFKMINDQFGHVAGDKVLVKVAQCLKETFRKDDFIARFGGDEFAVLIEGLSEEMAFERIVKFKDSFSKKRFFSHKDGDVRVGVSAGTTMAMKGDSPKDLIHRADMAMYDSKKKKP